jgi:hypothetical protein
VSCPLQDSEYNEHIDPEIPEHQVTSAFKQDANFILGDSSGYHDNTIHSSYITGPLNNYNTVFQQSPMQFPSHNVYIPSTLQNTGPSQPIVSGGQSQPSGQANLMCNGCQVTFGRPSEYRRHLNKHTGRTHPCTEPGCSKSFYRRDKLRDHLRQRHRVALPSRAQEGSSTGGDTAA